MRVALDLEQGPWMQLLAKAQEEGHRPDEVINAWVKRAIRQDRSVLPRTERPAANDTIGFDDADEEE